VGSSAACCASNGHLATTCSYGNSGGYLPNCTPCNGGDCVYWDDTNCACTGSCNNPQQYCCTGGCPQVQPCSTGCCDVGPGTCGFSFCSVGRSCGGGCSA
jgi:hypothetical protein